LRKFRYVARRCARGAVAVQIVLSLPLLVGVAALVTDLGLIVLARYRTQMAVDFGALAAVQALDLEALARGERRLVPEVATRDAQQVTRANLRSLAAGGSGADVRVDVHNVTERAPARDAWTNRPILQPTVCVAVSVPLGVFTTRLAGREVVVWAHADASVLERRRGQR
jgi:Flp pilus assembly protein TadG